MSERCESEGERARASESEREEMEMEDGGVAGGGTPRHGASV